MSIRKKPWNRVNSPVYSLVTKGADGFNMNICTYVTAVSMKPKRYMVAVYEGTQSLDNMQGSEEAVLQLLEKSQYKLVNYLGKKSGKTTKKLKYLTSKGLIKEWEGFPVLQDCLAVLKLKILHTIPGGDHVCFICDLETYKNLNSGKPLDVDYLREKNIVRM